jgi:hypothetical protein
LDKSIIFISMSNKGTYNLHAYKVMLDWRKRNRKAYLEYQRNYHKWYMPIYWATHPAKLKAKQRYARAYCRHI